MNDFIQNTLLIFCSIMLHRIFLEIINIKNKKN